MEKYHTFSQISSVDISEFRGLDTELKTPVLPSTKTTPLAVTTFGITYPNPKYYIKRPKSMIFVLEYVISGRGTVICNGKKFFVKANDVYILHPGDDCEYFADKNDPFHKYWVNFSSNLFYDILKKYNIHSQTVFQDVDLKQEFESLFRYDSDPCLNDSIYIPFSNIIFQMFMKIAASYNDAGKVSPLAQKIKNELVQTIKKPFHLDRLCNTLYLSKSQLIREFKKNYHTTPYQFLLTLRIETSKTLLKNTSKTIKEISQLLCFSSEYNFSNYFKKSVGISPSLFRK